MYKVRIDGIEIEVADAAQAKLLEQSAAKLAAETARADEAAAKADEAQKRADEAAGEVAALRSAQRTDEQLEAERIEWSRARAALLEAAGKLRVKLDSAEKLTNAQLQRAIVDGVEGVSLKEDATDDVVSGALAALLAMAPKVDVSRVDSAFSRSAGAPTSKANRLDDAVNDYSDRILNAWRPTGAGAA